MFRFWELLFLYTGALFLQKAPPPAIIDIFSGNRLVLNLGAPIRIGPIHNFEFLEFGIPAGHTLTDPIVSFVGGSYMLHDGNNTTPTGTSSKVAAIRMGMDNIQNYSLGGAVTLAQATTGQFEVKDDFMNDHDLQFASTLDAGARESRVIDGECSAHCDQEAGSRWQIGNDFTFISGNTYRGTELTATLLEVDLKGREWQFTEDYRLDFGASSNSYLANGGTESLKFKAEHLTLAAGKEFEITGDTNFISSGHAVDIDEIDAPKIILTDTPAWDSSANSGAGAGVRFGTLTAGAGYQLTSPGEDSATVEKYVITGDLTVTGTLPSQQDTRFEFHIDPEHQDMSRARISTNAPIDLGTSLISLKVISNDMQVGEQILLFETTSTNVARTNQPVIDESDPFLEYTFELIDTSTPVLGRLSAQLTGRVLTEEGDALPEDIGDPPSTLIYQGSDFLVSEGLTAAYSAATSKGPQMFGIAGGGRIRNNTGSHVDVKGHNLIVGTSVGLSTQLGQATLGGFFEYGKGDYDSRHTFSNGSTTGTGDTEYKGAGILGRFDFPNQLYVEGSLRGGEVKGEYDARFEGNAPLSQDYGFQYDLKSRYTGIHAGVGRVWEASETVSIDTYGKVLLTHQRKNSVDVWVSRQDGTTVSEEVKRSSALSQRLKLGVRANYRFTKSFTGYAGMAYDYEFDGKVKSTVEGVRATTPDLRGGTSMAEFGLKGRLSPKSPISFDFGLRGYAGQREGVTWGVRANYDF